MAKIGIITITRSENYGNKLQNYAVQQVIKKLGFEPETIRNNTIKGFNRNSKINSKVKKLIPSYICKVIKTRIKKKLMIKNDTDGILKSMVWIRKFKTEIAYTKQKKIEKFNNFNKEYIRSSPISISLSNFNTVNWSGYEYFICGSDQIWNPYYPQTSMIDFLGFAPKEKRVAYAPSFGVDHIPENKIQEYMKWLNEIRYLSVREEEGKEIIKDLSGREAQVLIDPTMMLEKKEWLSIAKKPEFNIKGNYILTYFLGNKTREYSKIVNKIAETYSCEVINLFEIRELDYYIVDPCEFIYLLNNAKLVCTDSFHGIALSIIMQKDFIVFDRVEDGHSMGSRIKTLLEKFQIEGRHFKNHKCILEFGSSNNNSLFNTDYSYISKILEIERKKAIDYLKLSLGIRNE